MRVAVWDVLKPASDLSGLKRYVDELCSFYEKQSDIQAVRYYMTGATDPISRLKAFMHYKSGDVTHITTHQIAFIGKLRCANNCVVTVHDLIQHHYYSLKRSVRETWFPNELTLKLFDYYITDSYYTKMDLVYSYGVPEEKIRVIYLGVDHTVFSEKDREECRKKFNMLEDEVYLLSVSSGEPWKNTGILRSLPYTVLDIGYGRGQFGMLEDERLADLYCACDAFLAPSKAEGFGLPVVEAMACGTPVIASNCTSFPEIIGMGGKLVNPDDSKAWVCAIEDVLGYRGYWSKKALEQAKKFSWDKTGRETWKLYEEIHSNSRS